MLLPEDATDGGISIVAKGVGLVVVGDIGEILGEELMLGELGGFDAALSAIGERDLGECRHNYRNPAAYIAVSSRGDPPSNSRAGGERRVDYPGRFYW